MTVQFDKSFLRKLKKERNRYVLSQIKSIILEAERTEEINQIRNIKKMAGYKSFYRIRFGSYRMGLISEGDTLTIITYGHRNTIYDSFPGK